MVQCGQRWPGFITMQQVKVQVVLGQPSCHTIQGLHCLAHQISEVLLVFPVIDKLSTKYSNTVNRLVYCMNPLYGRLSVLSVMDSPVHSATFHNGHAFHARLVCSH